MFTPDCNVAGDMDRIMLLTDWARIRRARTFAIGAPSFPIEPCVPRAFIKHFEEIAEASQKAHELLETPDAEINLQTEIIACDAAIGYGDPAGDIDPRVTVAKVLSDVYRQIDIKPRNVIFTVGAAGALHAIFKVINDDVPGGLIVTALPYYPLYKNNLYPINLMSESGYRLTAAALAKALRKFEEKQKYEDIKIGAFLLCNPNNPTGSIIDREEGRKIAEILDRYSVPIICDEAYAGLQLYDDYTSFAEIACDFPNVIKNIIGIRTGTKDSSAAGERLAFIYGFNDEMLTKIKASNIAAYGHAPRASQIAYAQALQAMYEPERKPLIAKKINFYRSQVEFVANGLKLIGAEMPDQEYKVTGTFYIMCDLSDLIGMPIPAEAKQALGDNANIILTDDDIAYSLLFEYGFAIAPLSYFGVNPSRGQLRITCSAGKEALAELMNCLEICLQKARLHKLNQYVDKIIAAFVKLNNLNREYTQDMKDFHDDFYDDLLVIFSDNTQLDPLSLKKKNYALNIFLEKLNEKIAAVDNEDTAITKATITLQKWTRGFLIRKNTIPALILIREKWAKSALDDMSETFLTKNAAKRQKVSSWQSYLSMAKDESFWPTSAEISEKKQRMKLQELSKQLSQLGLDIRYDFDRMPPNAYAWCIKNLQKLTNGSQASSADAPAKNRAACSSRRSFSL